MLSPCLLLPLALLLGLARGLAPSSARAAPPALDPAEVAAWCATACGEPEEPAEKFTTVSTQKLVGGRLTTVSSEVPTAAGRKWEAAHAAWKVLVGDDPEVSCAVRCQEAVLATQKQVKGLTLARVATVMAPTATGEVVWARVACERSAACANEGRCGSLGTRCVATAAGCAATTACKAYGRCQAHEGRCRRAAEFDCKQATACAELGHCTPYDRGCGPATGTRKGDFVFIGPGTFAMGSPPSEDARNDDEASHPVTITRPFWLQATEVTQGQWQALMGSNPSGFASCGRDCPVENVSWDDAVAFLNRLSDKEGLERCYDGTRFKGLGCRGYRLPTEAEWECAARAGTTGARYADLDAIAWYDRNAGGRTRQVGQKSPNRWGLHDMLGNVWEWVQDWYGSYDSVATDPTGPSSGGNRVSRGGGWGLEARHLRAANRDRDAPQYRFDFLGFRAARSIP